MPKNSSLEHIISTQNLLIKFTHCRIIYNSEKTENSLHAQQKVL